MKIIVSLPFIFLSSFLFSGGLYSDAIRLEEVSPIIQRHIQFLSSTQCPKSHKISFSGIHCNNVIIIECLDEIEKTQTFAPLSNAWKKLKKSPSLDTAAVGQFSIILLISYHISLGYYTNKNRLAWLSLISLYAQLNMIPLKKLFEALDECLQQYQAILESYPREKNESWDVWLQKHWVIPVAAFVFTFYSFIRWRYTHSVNSYK